jgi:hypothetical protein
MEEKLVYNIAVLNFFNVENRLPPRQSRRQRADICDYLRGYARA